MAGHLDAAAWAHLADTPPSPTDQRCASCGAPCRRCVDSEPCAKARWCAWCANAFALNEPGADGVVYCVGCGLDFGDLASLITSGRSQYPTHCRDCRDRTPAPLPDPPAPGPELDRDGPELADRPPATPKPAAARSDASTSGKAPADPEAEALALHLTGGFRPRPTAPAAHAPGAPVEPTYVSEWGDGRTVHPIDAARAAFGDGWGR